MSFDVLAEGLQFPEGPIAMPDGSVILVEVARGTLSRVWNGKIEVVCDLGGRPNGAARGAGGAGGEATAAWCAWICARARASGSMDPSASTGSRRPTAWCSTGRA